jgi:hypothetical protein
MTGSVVVDQVAALVCFEAVLLCYACSSVFDSSSRQRHSRLSLPLALLMLLTCVLLP